MVFRTIVITSMFFQNPKSGVFFCRIHTFSRTMVRATGDLLTAEYAKSPKGLKVNDQVKVDVDAQRLEELQTQREAWDPELANVRVLSSCSLP